MSLTNWEKPHSVLQSRSQSLVKILPSCCFHCGRLDQTAFPFCLSYFATPPPCFLCPTMEWWLCVQPWRAHSASAVFTEVTHLQEKRKNNWADLYFRLARANTPSAQCWFLFSPGHVPLTHQAVRTMSLGVTCQIHPQCKCCVCELWSADVPF